MDTRSARRIGWRAAVAALSFGVVSVGAVPDAHAATVALDPSFGTGGIVVSAKTGGSPADVLVQPDGKLAVVVAFNDDPAATQVFGVQRHRADGTVDTAFGQAGRATAAFTNFISSPADALLQPDGKIVVVGTASEAQGTSKGFAVVRFNADGTRDATFGAGGLATTNPLGAAAKPGSRAPATTVVVQPDGKILVGGSARACVKCTTNTALVRYLANGTLDPSFGTAGIVSVAAVGEVSGLALDATGTIVVVGGVATAEFSPTGALRPGTTHSALTARSARGFQTAPLAFGADGRYLVERGVARPSSPYRDDIDSQVSRYLADASGDPSFVSPPFAFTDDPGRANDRAQSIALRANGQVMVAGYRTAGGVSSFAVARLGATGALDPTFGAGGRAIVALPAGGHASFVVEQPDGKVVVAGLAFIEGSTDVNLALVRLAA